MVELTTHETMFGMRAGRGPLDPMSAKVALGLASQAARMDRLRTRWLRRFAMLAARRSPQWDRPALGGRS